MFYQSHMWFNFCFSLQILPCMVYVCFPLQILPCMFLFCFSLQILPYMVYSLFSYVDLTVHVFAQFYSVDLTVDGLFIVLLIRSYRAGLFFCFPLQILPCMFATYLTFGFPIICSQGELDTTITHSSRPYKYLSN